MTTKFSAEEDEQIIDFVESKPFLFKVADANYKNGKMKTAAWAECGTLIGKNGAECAKRWTSIKDYYVRQKKKGNTCSSPFVMKRMERLHFLKGRLNFMKGTSIIHRPIQSNVNQSIVAAEYEDMFAEEDEVGEEGNEMNDSFADSGTPSASRDIKKMKKNTTESTATLFDGMKQDRQIRHKNKMDFLKNVLSTSAVPPPPPPMDGVASFLHSIGETMRQLPPRKLAEVKLQIQKLICEAELATIEEISPQISYVYAMEAPQQNNQTLEVQPPEQLGQIKIEV